MPTCDFSPTWPSAPTYNGSLLGFIVAVLEWGALVVGSAIFDLIGGLVIGLACLVYAALLAPIDFLYDIFVRSIPYYAEFGPWGPLVGVLVFSGVVLVLVALFILLYRVIPENLEATTEEIEGKEPPETESSSEFGEAASEV